MQDRTSRFSRRDAVRFGAMGGLGVLLGGATRALARDPAPATTMPTVESMQGAGIYRLKLGDATVTIVSDGGFPSKPEMLYPKISKSDVDAMANRAHLSPDGFIVHINTVLIERGMKRTLIDTGAGNNFGPGAGHLQQNLSRLGITPGDIDFVVLSHLHPDHVGGLLDASGKVVFSKARVIVNRAEHDFWMQPDPKMPNTLLPPDSIAGMVKAAQGAINGARGVLDIVKPGDVAGVTLIDTPGHTPGHVAIRVGSGADSLVYTGDAFIAPELTLMHPEWHVLFDADPVQAATTRKALLNSYADDGTLIAPAHVSFPALGYIEQQGQGYRWVPRNWEW